MKRRNADTTTCPYCELKLRGLASHIRIAHPGLPYNPTQEQITLYRKATTPAAIPVPAPPVQIDAEFLDDAPTPSNLPPTSHLAIAIKGLLAELDKVQGEITELESRHPGLIEKRGKIKYDLEILEKANAAILDNANTRERQLAEAEREVARAER
jgi:hypothetical protein